METTIKEAPILRKMPNGYKQITKKKWKQKRQRFIRFRANLSIFYLTIVIKHLEQLVVPKISLSILLYVTALWCFFTLHMPVEKLTIGNLNSAGF